MKVPPRTIRTPPRHSPQSIYSATSPLSILYTLPSIGDHGVHYLLQDSKNDNYVSTIMNLKIIMTIFYSHIRDKLW